MTVSSHSSTEARKVFELGQESSDLTRLTQNQVSRVSQELSCQQCHPVSSVN